jgi:hypothetical protein
MAVLKEKTIEVLKANPKIKRLVAVARKEPLFQPEYIPQVIEAFDQNGLVCGIAWGEFYSSSRDLEHEFDFVAWFFDGALGVFYSQQELLVNRIPKVVVREEQ